jgi:hypothetical protein
MVYGYKVLASNANEMSPAKNRIKMDHSETWGSVPLKIRCNTPQSCIQTGLVPAGGEPVDERTRVLHTTELETEEKPYTGSV